MKSLKSGHQIRHPIRTHVTSDQPSDLTSDSDMIILSICHLLAAEIQAPPSHCHWSAAHTAENYDDNYDDNQDNDDNYYHNYYEN